VDYTLDTSQGGQNDLDMIKWQEHTVVMGKSIRIDSVGQIDSNRFTQPNQFG